MIRLLLLIGICLFNLKIYSQNRKIEYGIILGFQNSSFYENDDSIVNYTGKIGYHAGVSISYIVNDKISIRPEVLYFERGGSNFEMKGGGSSVSFFNSGNNKIFGEIKESLVFFPVMLEYKLNNRFSTGLGPAFGYSINRKVEYDDNRFDEFIKNNSSNKFELNLGIDFRYSINKLAFFIKYNYGITERQNLKTSIFQLGMNYKL